MWVVVGGGRHFDHMTKLSLSALILGVALSGCAQSSDNGGGGTGTDTTRGSGGKPGTGGASSGGSAGASASGGGSGGSSSGGGSSGSGGASVSGGSSGSGAGAGGSSAGGSGVGGSGAGGSTGAGGSGTGGGSGDAGAADGGAGATWKNCLEPVYSSILPAEFCMVYEAVCGFGGTNHYKTKADCMMKFKGGASDADACKSGHLCRASKQPATREMDCQTAAYSPCKN
jgi:hypothetical protein